MSYRYTQMFARISLFIIYFWFGILKLLNLSPANPLVNSLQQKMLPMISSHDFMIGFAIFEMVIGIAFLFSRFSSIAYTLFFIHMAMTIVPLFMLPKMTWQSTLVPTLEGQYIIKNLALISTVLFLMTSRRR